MSYYDEIEKHYPKFQLPNGVLDADSNEFALMFNASLGSKVLEIGCNEEPLAYALSTLGFDVTGIDVRGCFVPSGKELNFNFIKGDFNKVEIKDKFDAVVLISTIEHVGMGAYGDEKDWDGDSKAMDKIYDVLNQNGEVYITVPVGAGHTTDDWRVYNFDMLFTRIIRKFRLIHLSIFASGVSKDYGVGDLVRGEDVIVENSPNFTAMLILGK
jgi:SAM-dependent methyltransferase